MKTPFPPEQVAENLLAWYGRHGRDLPWRQTRDPYRIWLSEIMLQQTTVAAAIPYYERFLDRFPDVTVLAEASLESVLQHWAGLGYYSRARNLHKTAQVIVREWDGRFPETVDELMRLPGIGRSTAGAVVSIAFDRPAPILDGNVRRVLTRLIALQQPPREKEAEKRLWSLAGTLTPADRAHDYAQAIMDLGATVCLPKRPLCPDCPLRTWCRAYAGQLQDVLPMPGPRQKIPTRRQVVLVVDDGARLLVRRRPPEGLLGGMWEFPAQDIAVGETSESVVDRLREEVCPGREPEHFGRITHVYSHFRLEADIYRVTVETDGGIADRQLFWQDAEKLDEAPLHGAHRKVLQLIRTTDRDNDTD